MTPGSDGPNNGREAVANKVEGQEWKVGKLWLKLTKAKGEHVWMEVHHWWRMGAIVQKWDELVNTPGCHH